MCCTYFNTNDKLYVHKKSDVYNTNINKTYLILSNFNFQRIVWSKVCMYSCLNISGGVLCYCTWIVHTKPRKYDKILYAEILAEIRRKEDALIHWKLHQKNQSKYC